MSVNGGRLKKNSQVETPTSPEASKLGTEHQRLRVYKVCIKIDIGMTLTYFTTRQCRLYMRLNGETITKLFNGYNMQIMDKTYYKVIYSPFRSGLPF